MAGSATLVKVPLGNRRFPGQSPFMSMLQRALLCALLVAISSTTATAICGDVDESGQLVTSDALTVLRGAIGLGGELLCPTCLESVECDLDDTHCDSNEVCQNYACVVP